MMIKIVLLLNINDELGGTKTLWFSNSLTQHLDVILDHIQFSHWLNVIHVLYILLTILLHIY